MRYFAILFFVIICNNYVLADTNKNISLNDLLKQYDLYFQSADTITVTKNIERSGTQKKFHTIIAELKKHRINIEIITPFAVEKAERFIFNKYEIIKNLYEPQFTPYPGEITNISECPQHLKPLEKEVEILEKQRSILIANAGKRYTLGVWDEKIIHYKCLFAIIFDRRKNTVIQIKFFIPLQDYSEKDALAFLSQLKYLK